MGRDLALTTNGSGVIEQFGASVALADQLTQNFSDRGTKAARLLCATLTESPFKPEIDGTTFGIDVSNVYQGHGVDSDVDEATDTVIIARNALKEFATAEVPGAKKLALGKYKTHYQSIFDAISPDRKTPAVQRSAFDEAFVLSARDAGVGIANPEQGRLIIKRAPKTISGLLLEEPDAGILATRSQRLLAVTTDGHMVGIEAYRRGSMSPFYVRLYQDSDKLHLRGGSAPGSTIANKIGARVLKLRTGHTKR